ncbi:unnamed protein product [Urochloa decumbens]|uniref:Uncharacterized protein n=1 Tax=Urochloa decumbens TaxID=240449 RepID=A0ABC9EA82_9POAL
MDIGGSGGGIILSPGTEDDKLARRRSRRVSFADITAVHVFDRDEDFETPPDGGEPGSASPSPSPGRSSAEREDGDDTEDFHCPPVIFLPHIDSSSPGSAAGSIASADDDNFFGPVSTSFIQIGRPSDSGMSEDDNHDITMDSKTFSMHFRNIAPPDDCTGNSAASLMTPDMASKGPLKELTVSDPGRTLSRTDMSLFSGNSRSFNYGKLSHTLNSVLEKVKAGKQTESPRSGIAGVTPDSVLTLSASEEENREENLCNGNGISSDELGTVNTIAEHTSMSNLVSNSTCLIQEDNEMIIDGHENSQNGNNDHTVVDSEPDLLDPSPATNKITDASQLSTAAPAILLMDAEQLHQQNEVMDRETILHTPKTVGQLLQAPQGSISSLRLKRQKLFSATPLSPPYAPQLSTAAPAILLMDTEQLHQQNEVMDRETILHTPRTVDQLLQAPQGSISYLRLKRQKLFSATPLSNSKVASQEACSLSSEFDEHDKTISAPRNVDWNKVLSTISNATEQVLSASISKLNSQQLDVLSDKLDEIHMARKYERLSAAVRIKGFRDDKQKRLEEARSLHEKLFYEKAKLQINKMKLAKLKNKAQLYQDGIQECRVLKSEILRAAQMKDSCLPAETSMNANEKQEELAILTEKRVELNDVQQKVENLRSSLECFRNIEGDINCDSVMKHAEEQLKLRNQCHLIHQQAGLCELNDIVKRDNKRDLVLNYHNLLFQRIILNTSGVSSIFVNNSLNGTKIGQTFPNLDASVAFNFVFKAEENQRVCDLQSLQKTTMETSLLLGNLIDVLEEIKLAKMELLNLTSAAFVLESQTCQLGLSICFMSFKSGKKFAFIMDMTDLKCSVYPSDPSELPIKVCEAQTTLAQASIDETMASIRNLQPGRTVILRLCRMVSRLIHSLPR